jgi:hypothetical protein
LCALAAGFLQGALTGMPRDQAQTLAALLS